MLISNSLSRSDCSSVMPLGELVQGVRSVDKDVGRSLSYSELGKDMFSFKSGLTELEGLKSS